MVKHGFSNYYVFIQTSTFLLNVGKAMRVRCPSLEITSTSDRCHTSLGQARRTDYPAITILSLSIAAIEVLKTSQDPISY